MNKIRITEQTQDIEYDFIADAIVMPFGTSGHIPSRKEYIGRAVKIIYLKQNKRKRANPIKS